MAASLTLFATAASACPDVYSALECSHVSGGSISVETSGVITNSSTASTMRVHCPITRPSNSGSGYIYDFRMRVADNNLTSNQFVECFLECRDVDDNTFTATVSDDTDGSSNGSYLSLDFSEDLDPAYVDPWTDGACYVFCDIPKATSGIWGGISGVNSYAVDYCSL
jgi:hypothetical protein